MTVQVVKGGSIIFLLISWTKILKQLSIYTLHKVRIDNYPNLAVCYVDLGQTCNNGVEVEISYMTIETYNYGWDAETEG